MNQKQNPKAALVRTIRYRLPLFAYCALIFWQSSYAVPMDMPSIPYLDKLLHAGGYALLGLLSARALKSDFPGLSSGRLLFWAILVSTLFGIFDEFHQSFVSSRTADAFDALFDALGSAAGAIFYIRYAWYTTPARKTTLPAIPEK
ncbi:MAG: VanZ family protein [Pseudomonadota bacterium]